VADRTNHLEPWAQPPNIFAGTPAAQAFLAQMSAAQNWRPQRQSQPAPQSAPQSPLAAYAFGSPSVPTAAPASPLPTGVRQPRSVRTNNPGAIEFGPFAQRHGAIGSDGRFATFPDMATGYGAMDRLLGSYGQRGLNTVTGIIGRWAPRAADGNATDAYIGAVSRAIGIHPTAPIPPEMMPRVAEAMAQFEAGQPVPRY